MDREELLKKAQKEADPKAQMEQFKLMYRQPDEVELRGKIIRVYPIVGAPQDLVSLYSVEQVEVETDQIAEAIAKIRPNLKLQYKAASIGILNDPSWGGWKGLLKIKLFHGIHWRIMRWKYDPSDIADLMAAVINKLGISFFFQNMALMKEMNTLKRKRTKEEVELL